MKLSRLIIHAVSLAFLCALGAAAAQELPRVNLKVSGGNKTQNQVRYVQTPFFTKELAEASQGAITATFGTLDDLGIQGPEVLRLLRLGMFDISEGTLSYMAGDAPQFEGLDMPGLTADIGVQRQMANAYRPELARVMAERFNVRFLSMAPIALQVLYCKGKIGNLDDLKGKKVRTYNRVMAEQIEALGAQSVNITFAEVVPALERGVADCSVSGTSAGNTARWWEVTDSLLMLPMGWAITFFGANIDSWNRLNPAAQKFLTEQFAAMEDRQWAQAGADIQDGINCNTAMGECKDGIVASRPMTLVTLSDAEMKRVQELLNDGVLKNWGQRCGAECFAQWKSTAGAVVGLDKQ
jgi:TRAP-type C4-dicarboxylate transport system substrate-binding protein